VSGRPGNAGKQGKQGRHDHPNDYPEYEADKHVPRHAERKKRNRQREHEGADYPSHDTHATTRLRMARAGPGENRVTDAPCDRLSYAQ
jgi:hypothetical protein